MKIKLTKTAIEGLRANPEGDRVTLDTVVIGFGVRVTRKGSKSFIFQWGRGARRMRMTLGAVGTMNLEEARRKAAKRRNKVTAGRDPGAKRKAAKAEPTVRELGERFLREHAAHKAPSTARLYRLVVERHLVPLLGSRLVSAVRWEDLARLRAKLSDRPTLANRAMVTCSMVWEFGRKVGSVARDAPNPARGHDRADERRRGRALDREQLARVGQALAAEGDTFQAGCFRFLILTGARPGEAFAARWPDVDLVTRRWHLREAKAGERTVYLGHPAVELLRALPRLASCDLLFPGRALRSLWDLKSLWRRVHAAAELPAGFRLYDATRHTFATAAAELGVPRDIRKLLTGHAPGREACDSYLHATAEPLRQADRVSEWLAAALSLATPKSA